MTSEPRTPEQIERDIERDRAGLSSALGDLQDKVSFDGIVRQVSEQFRDHGGEIGTALTKSIKQNPLALAVTGIGLAWLMMGSRDAAYRESRGYNDDGRDYDRNYSRSDAQPQSSHSFYDRPSAQPPISRPQPDRLGANASSMPTTPEWARRTDPSAATMYDRSRSGDGVMNKPKGAYNTAADKAAGVASSVADTASSIKDGAGDYADRVQDRVSGTVHDAASWAERMRAQLAEGTEELEHEARERIIAARQRALEARDAAWEQARIGRDRAVNMFEDQPLIAGAIALAVGAAIGAALPRTQTEDHALGEQSDALMHEAEQIFADEKAKLTRVAQAVGDEVRSAADDIKDTAIDAANTVAAKARESGQRVADAAKSEVEHQGVGKKDL